MARFLIFSNAPGFSATGYSGQAEQLTKSLTELGHEVDILASYGFFGGAFPLGTGGTMFGSGGRPPSGEDRFPVLMRNKQYDVVITLTNCWPLDTALWSKMRDVCDFQLYSIDPVERYPMTDGQKNWYEETGSTLIPLTSFALEEAERNGVAHTDVIPHTIDEVFSFDGEAPREQFQLPVDRPIIGIVGANSGAHQGWLRKSFDTMFLAVRDLLDNTKHKDALIWAHTNAADSHSGTDLVKLAKKCGLGKEDVRFTPPQLVYHPLSGEDLAKAYRCMDVFVHASKAEGFGLCSLEAQACGVPVIGTKSRLTPGMTYLGSELKQLNPIYDASQCGFIDVPSPQELRRHISKLLENPPKAQVRRRKAGEVRRDFDRVSVRDRCWKPLFDEVPTAVADWSKLSGIEEI